MKKVLTIHGSSISYEIERVKNRKTIQLAFVSNGHLHIRVPHNLAQRDIERILTSEMERIYTLWTKQQKQLANPLNSEIKDGAPILYLGQSYSLSIREAPRNQVYIDGDTIIVLYKPSDTHPAFILVRKLLLDWYTKQAATVLSSRTAHWAQIIGVKPQKITIRDQKTRWGSCSNKGSINYSWRLIMAPSAALDYVVVHELCHMHQPNHSKAFWDLVSRYIPDYSHQRQWLKDYGSLLMRFDVNQV